MFRATLIPDAGQTAANEFVFFNSSRSLTEMNVRLNNQPLFQRTEPIRAGFAVMRLRGNRRNQLTVSVRRDVETDLSSTFADAEAALAFALNCTTAIPVIGTLRLELRGKATNLTFWMKNAIIPAHSMNEWLGVAPKFDFTFDGGEIVKSNPLIQ